MAVVLLPDVEAIVSAYLRQHADVTALIGQKVYGELPTKSEPDYPVVRITRVAGAPTVNTSTGRPVLDAPLIQVDVFGGTNAQVRTIARTIQAALVDLPAYSNYVTGVRLGSLASQPDTDYTPPKPRIRLDLTVFARS